MGDPVESLAEIVVEKCPDGAITVLLTDNDGETTPIVLYPSYAAELRDGLSEALQPDDQREGASLVRYRHKKRGTEYELVGFGKMQVERWVEWKQSETETVDMREVAVYRSVDDGSLWVRPREEFEDGRFEAVEVEK